MTQGQRRRHSMTRTMSSPSTWPSERWTTPPVGWTKLNVDGSWREADSTGGAGMILHDHIGAIIYSSCRFITSCASPLEAEVEACREGIALALEWSNNEPFILETDSTTAANMIMETDQNRSPVAALVGEIKRLLSIGPEHVISHVSRSRNKVSHMLAQMGLSIPHTAVWLRNRPDEIGTLCQQDCNELP